MEKSAHAYSIIARIYLQTLKIVPVSGMLSLLHYAAQGLFPAAVLFTASKLYEAVYRFSGEQSGDAVQQMYRWGLLLLGCYAVKNLLAFISSITVNAGVYEKCVSYNRMQIGAKAARLPLLYYENAEILNAKNRALECVNREMLSQIFMSAALFITGGAGIVGVCIVLASYSPYLLPLGIISVFPYFIARLIRGKEFYRMRYFQAEKTRYRDYLWQLLTDKRSIKEMKLMRSHGYFIEKWAEYRDAVNEALWSETKKDLYSVFWCDALRIGGYASCIIVSLILAVRGVIGAGVFGACIAAFLSVQEETKRFLIEAGRLSEKIRYAKDFFAFLDLPEEEASGDTSCPVRFSDAIVLKDVCFAYPHTQAFAVRDVSLTIGKGKKIVIVGENGSGKTTLIKLILGFYPAVRGSIAFDGQAIETIDKNALYRQVSLIQQRFTQYELSVRENVGISAPETLHDDKRILGALEKSGLHCFSQADLDYTLGTQFGDTELSGGQWQKLAIARALFRDSSIIVLDEPTSALDPLVEADILKHFLAIAADKTAVIISHRVGLCKYADTIVVMKNGAIVETGRHQQLLEKNGEYACLYTAQSKWYRHEPLT